MKIAIASLGETLDSKVSPHFGRAPYFVFVEVENNEVKNVKAERNLLAQNHEHGAIPQMMIKNNVDLVISAGIGNNAKNHLEQAGVKLVQTQIITLKEALQNLGIKVD